jgi:hypothetical protein
VEAALNPDRSRVELFDISADPSEEDNLAPRHPEVVERLGERALAWQKTPPGLVEPAAGKKGYPGRGRTRRRVSRGDHGRAGAER